MKEEMKIPFDWCTLIGTRWISIWPFRQVHLQDSPWLLFDVTWLCSVCVCVLSSIRGSSRGGGGGSWGLDPHPPFWEHFVYYFLQIAPSKWLDPPFWRKFRWTPPPPPFKIPGSAAVHCDWQIPYVYEWACERCYVLVFRQQIQYSSTPADILFSNSIAGQPALFAIHPTPGTYADAVVSIIQQFGWQRLLVISNSAGDGFFNEVL